MAISTGMNHPKEVGKGRVSVSGSFAPAGTGAVTDVNGAGFTVARTGAGAHLITFNEVGKEIVSAAGTVQLNAAADMAVQFGAYDSAARTLVLRTVAGATPTDIAANANNRVHFRVVWRNTSVDY